MVQFRSFRNTDPPLIVDAWNEIFTSRGAAFLPNPSFLDRYVLSKTIFDPQGFLLALDEGKCLGFAHASLAEPTDQGVVCVLGVRPQARRRGIGTELLQRAEAYLRERGAAQFVAGGVWPLCPFYVGLLGGAEPAGVLDSDVGAQALLEKQGYAPVQTRLVFQRDLEANLKCFDARFAALRQRFDIQLVPPRALPSRWHEIVFGAAEPAEAVLLDRQTQARLARTFVWEMEGFTYRWQRPSVGIFDLFVAPEQRRKGLGKYLLYHLLRHLKEQFFLIAELHVDSSDTVALPFVKSLGFEHVDTGRVYRKA